VKKLVLPLREGVRLEIVEDLQAVLYGPEKNIGPHQSLAILI
jgi:hypothetical protein